MNGTGGSQSGGKTVVSIWFGVATNGHHVVWGIILVLRSGAVWRMRRMFLTRARPSTTAFSAGLPKGAWCEGFYALNSAGGPPAQVLIDSSAVKAWQQGDPIREILWLYPRLPEERALRRIHRRKRTVKRSQVRMRRYAESMAVGMRSPTLIGLFALVLWAIGTAPAAAGTLGQAPVTAAKGHCIEPGQAGATAARRSRGSAGVDKGSAGMRVYIDPVTRDFAELPTGRTLAPSASSSTAHAGLVETRSRVPGGGVTVDLQGRFRSSLVATIGTDGKLAIRHLPCVQDADDRGAKQ